LPHDFFTRFPCYRLIVRKSGGFVRLFTRKGVDYTVRLPAIAASVAQLKAQSCTLDGEAAVVGPDGLSQFDHIVEEGSVVFDHACRLGAEGIVSKRLDAPYRSGPTSTWIKVKNPAAVEVQRGRSENWN
jgi:ATP-dependent DNA ligase